MIVPAHQLASCPLCEARIGESCVTLPYTKHPGKRTQTHAARLTAAKHAAQLVTAGNVYHLSVWRRMRAS